MAAAPDRQLAQATGALLDQLEQAALIFDVQGALLHESRQFQAIARGEPDGSAVRRAARALAVGRAGGDWAPRERRTGVAAGPVDGIVLGTASARYRLRRQVMSLAAGGGRVATTVVVLVTGTPLGRSVDELLHGRYSLTPREAVVAQLLAAGLSVPRIAGRLGISVHTVRRHTEQVHRKLGVHTRLAVAECVRALAGARDGTLPPGMPV